MPVMKFYIWIPKYKFNFGYSHMNIYSKYIWPDIINKLLFFFKFVY